MASLSSRGYIKMNYAGLFLGREKQLSVFSLVVFFSPSILSEVATVISFSQASRISLILENVYSLLQINKELGTQAVAHGQVS